MRYMIKNILLGMLLFTVSADTIIKSETALSDDDYELVFSDEFNLPDGSQPDSRVWSNKPRNPDTCNRWNSGSKKAVYIKDGVLVCKAVPNKSERGDTARMLTGSVWTYGKYNVKYGKIEVRMRTNTKKGNFPAAWLKWQNKGIKSENYSEIDIVEMFGNRKAAHHTAHSQLTVSNKRHGENNTFVEKLNVKKWHVYGIEWTPTYITWTVDGKPVGTYYKSKNERLLKQGQWTFDSPCYIVLNQSVGDGSYSHMVPNCKTTYETQFDWIRVYQKKKGKTTKEIKESADFNLVF